MILRNATILYSGNDPDILTKGSHIRVCISCDKCGRIRWAEFRIYRSLCRSCIAKNKPKSEEHKANMKKNHNHISGEDHWNYGKKLYGKDNPNYGNYWSDIQKENMSNKMSGENNPHWGKKGSETANWKGGVSNDRSHILPINRCDCLNKRFKGSAGHHINKDIVIFIPKELHKHIYHNLKSGQGIDEMNILAYQFLKGGFK